MATLERIRSNGALLIGVIAFALLVFIVGDFLKNSGRAKGGNTIAEINGAKIGLNDYQQKVNTLQEVFKVNSNTAALDESTTDQIYRQVWDDLLREYIMEPECNAIGLAVSKEELNDRILGANTDPIIRQMFTNPNTGQFDRSIVINYLKQVNQEEYSARKAHWLYYEGVIKSSRLNTKYNTLLAKGIMVTPKEAELAVNNMKDKKSIEFFAKPYSSITDSLVTVSNKDIQSYYNEHKELYKQGTSRSIEYVTFPIVASSDDYKSIEKWINEAKTEIEPLSKVSEIRNYVKLNSDQAWNEVYQSKDQVNTRYQEFAFNNEVGSVYGPYLDGTTYKIAKLASREMRADSVKASHILIQGQDVNAATVLADSLLAVVKAKPSTFAELAKTNSADQGSAAEGGDLGWFKEGMMVKPFNDACFSAKKGDIVKVTSQFGIHIIYVTAVGAPVEKVNIAEVSRKVEPSTETYRAIYSEASKFLGQMDQKNSYDKFTEVIAKDKLSKRSASLDKNAKAVNDMTKARQLVQWAYKAEIGNISDIMEINDKYVVAALTEISEDGYQPLSAVSGRIKAQLLKDKKAEMIMAQINEKKAGSESLSSLAQKMQLTVRNASDIDFQSYNVAGAGVEPALVGAVVTAKKDVISDPVKGTNGVYVFRVVSSTPAADVMTADAMAQSKSASYGYRISYQALNALEDLADVTDDRYRFY